MVLCLLLEPLSIILLCSFSQAVAKMVQECYKYVDAVSDLTIKLRLIDTLRTVTAGKVWLPCFHWAVSGTQQ